MQPDQTLSSQNPALKTYSAILSQTGTAAPVATILNNTLGATPIWTYDSTGVYVLTLSGAFPFGKTQIITSQNAGELFSGDWDMPDAIYIGTTDSAGAPANNQMSMATIIVNVYR